MESMTGFASVEAQSGRFQFSVVIRTLNSKYPEIIVNLPRALKAEEHQISRYLQDKIGRGRIELSVEISQNNAERRTVFNAEVLKSYYFQLLDVKNELGLNETPVIEKLLSLEGVAERDRAFVYSEDFAVLYKALDRAAEMLLVMRKREGTVTVRDIKASLKNISNSLRSITALSKKGPRQKFLKLRDRIADLTARDIDESRLYTEIALIAEKSDINEELVRLGDHIGKMNIILAEGGEAGKKIDFLAQEMFREINTIMSKAGNSDIAHNGVEIKNFIEKIREQSRNIA